MDDDGAGCPSSRPAILADGGYGTDPTGSKIDGLPSAPETRAGAGENSGTAQGKVGALASCFTCGLMTAAPGSQDCSSGSP